MFEGERLTRNNVPVNKHFGYKLMGRSSTLHYKCIALIFNKPYHLFIVFLLEFFLTPRRIIACTDMH